MKYTTDQLIALLEEARGYVHDAAMGAIWTKERHQKMTDFMERTNVVEYTATGGYEMEKSLPPFSKKIAPSIQKDIILKSTPENVARELIAHGYTGGFGSIEDEVKNLKEKDKLIYGRDFLRKVVKLIRAHKPSKRVDQVTKDLVTTQPIHPDTMKKAFGAAKKADKLAPTAVTPLTVDKVFGPNPKEKACDLFSMGYKSPGGSVDSEVADLKKSGRTESRDFLREVVKIIRSKQGISK